MSSLCGFGTQIIGCEELTEFSPRKSVKANKLTEFGVSSRAFRNRIWRVSEKLCDRWEKGAELQKSSLIGQEKFTRCCFGVRDAEQCLSTVRLVLDPRFVTISSHALQCEFVSFPCTLGTEQVVIAEAFTWSFPGARDVVETLPPSLQRTMCSFPYRFQGESRSSKSALQNLAAIFPQWPPFTFLRSRAVSAGFLDAVHSWVCSSKNKLPLMIL